MLLHQGIGLDAFNAMPMRRAVHAVYECCYSVPLAADLAAARPFDSHDQLFRHADSLLFGLARGLDRLDPAGLPRRRPAARAARSRRPSSAPSRRAPRDDGPSWRQASKAYLDHFGFGFVMFVNGYSAEDVLAAMHDRMLNDYETERKVVRNELARINRTRLERMLGPEGGYDNW